MEKHGLAVIRECQACQDWTIGKRYFQPRKHITAKLPWDHLQFDLITGSLEEVDGYKAVLVVVDVFTGFVVLKPLKSRDKEELVETLWKIFTVFGIPKLIQSDNEPSFISELSRLFLDKLRVNMLTITPYNHQALGVAEAHVKLVSKMLKQRLGLIGGRWLQQLDTVNFQLNTRILNQKGACSPFQLMFNRNPNCFPGLQELVDRKFAEVDDEAELMKWMSHQNLILSELFPAVAEKEKIMKDREAEAFKQKKGVLMLDPGALAVGTHVMLWDEIRASKNEPPYVGPYSITHVQANGNYLLKDVATNHMYHREVKLDRLKVCQVASMDVNNEEENSGFPLDFIMAHRVKNGKHQYKVRFAGWNPTSDEWLYAENVEQAAIRKFYAVSDKIKRSSQKVVEDEISRHLAMDLDAEPDHSEPEPVIVGPISQKKRTNDNRSSDDPEWVDDESPKEPKGSKTSLKSGQSENFSPEDDEDSVDEIIPKQIDYWNESKEGKRVPKPRLRVWRMKSIPQENQHSCHGCDNPGPFFLH
jgi:hypothetical protein